MESLERLKLFGEIYKGKTVVVTGHTGFKGSWLANWLELMGANVIGISLKPQTAPNHHELLNNTYQSVIADINNYDTINSLISKHKPEIIFHLAAQALVRYSYENPVNTFQTNVIGTINLYEAAKNCNSVKAIVNITSDKCYENKEWIWGYRENDAFGGHDPYSASKACSEIVTTSYRKSFFDKNNILLASARAGNVIGGGDWAMDRLIPDIIKATSQNTSVFIRSPFATRPWQHVLEPLSAYLLLGWRLLSSKKEYAEGWNFGPELQSNISVNDVVLETQKYWDKIDCEINTNLADLHEANLLMLDCSKAFKSLKWKPVWNFEECIKKTILWYKSFYEKNEVNTNNDLVTYINDAIRSNAIWTKQI